MGPALDHLNDFPASRSSETLSYQKVGHYIRYTQKTIHIRKHDCIDCAKVLLGGDASSNTDMLQQLNTKYTKTLNSPHLTVLLSPVLGSKTTTHNITQF